MRALLILLALDAGRAVPAFSLIERLWGDGEAGGWPAGAANALQSLVSRLRGALGTGVIEADLALGAAPGPQAPPAVAAARSPVRDGGR